MGHRLFTINVLPGVAGVYDDALMPVVGYGGHDAVDVLIPKQLMVAPRRRDRLASLPAENCVGQRMPAVVKIAGRHTLDARKADGSPEQPGTLHPYAHHAEAQSITGRDRF